MCCNRARPLLWTGSLPSSGASVARPAVAIRGTRLSLRPTFNATHRTNRDAHATPGHRTDQVPELPYMTPVAGPPRRPFRAAGRTCPGPPTDLQPSRTRPRVDLSLVAR